MNGMKSLSLYESPHPVLSLHCNAANRTSFPQWEKEKNLGTANPFSHWERVSRSDERGLTKEITAPNFMKLSQFIKKRYPDSWVVGSSFILK